MHGFMPIAEESRRALEIAERVALQAGELVMKGWRSVGEISRKGRFDLLTEYDLGSEQLIREQHAVQHDEEQLIQTARDTAHELELLLRSDRKQ